MIWMEKISLSLRSYGGGLVITLNSTNTDQSRFILLSMKY